MTPAWGYSTEQLWARLPQGRLIEGLIEPSQRGIKAGGRRVDRWVQILRLAVQRGGVTSGEAARAIGLDSRQSSSTLYNMKAAGVLSRTYRQRRGGGKACYVYAPTRQGKKYAMEAA